MAIKKRGQTGSFLMTRWVLLMLILVAMLVVPIWLKKSDDNKLKERSKTELALNAARPSAPATATATPDAAARPIGFGLSFAVAGAPSPQPNISSMSCHGQPPPTDRAHKGSCNPYAGDTSCRTVLPVLCITSDSTAKLDAANGDAPQGWTAATLGATAPVMGALLESRPIADARCQKELGPSWRMADFHAGGGWNVSGRTGTGLLAAGSTRYWVAINDSLGNCWDSPP